MPSKSRIRDLYFSRCSFYLPLARSASTMPSLRKATLPGMPSANFSSCFPMSLCSISRTVSCRLRSMASSVSISVPSISNMTCLYFLMAVICQVSLSICLITRQGLPTATQLAGMERATTLPAPMTLFRPIVTPGNRMAPPPIHTPSSILTGRA